MISSHDAALLTEIVSRESRSLLRYLSEAFPWVRTGASETLTRLHTVAREERDGMATLTRYLNRLRIVLPHPGSYPASYTSMNFVSLDYLIPRLVADQQRRIAALERDRAALSDADARVEVDRLLTLERQHTQVLQGMTPPVAAH